LKYLELKESKSHVNIGFFFILNEHCSNNVIENVSTKHTRQKYFKIHVSITIIHQKVDVQSKKEKNVSFFPSMNGKIMLVIIIFLNMMKISKILLTCML
jgi:hypothetical protein